MGCPSSRNIGVILYAYYKIVFQIALRLKMVSYIFNSSRPIQNGRRLADDSFNRIFLNENARISIQFSLKVVLKDPIDNKSAFGSGNGLARNRRRAITWTNAEPVHRRICAALGGDELTNACATCA